jgi:hypothetical protein
VEEWCKAVPVRFHYSDLPKLHECPYYKQILKELESLEKKEEKDRLMIS